MEESVLIGHGGARPRIDRSAWVAPDATIAGDVTIGPGCAVSHGAVVTAEGAGRVEIGADCVVMENAVVRGTRRHPVRIGARVLVGPHAHVTGCSVGDDAFLATGSVVFNGARVGEGAEVRIGAVVHVNSVVAPGTVVPIGWVAVGAPAQLFPPEDHEGIWAVQREMDFPGTVFGAARETSSGESTSRYARALRERHAGDATPAVGAAEEPVGEFSRWRPHPWHGLSPGPAPPSVVTVFVEITPFDLVKYEVDKSSGYLKVDRAQRTSSLPPSIYGFIPRTYAGPSVAALMAGSARGDHDPLDICVLSERPITRGEVLLHAKVVGGLPMLDGGEADDKILAVFRDDPVYGDISEVDQLPRALVDRLIHYFSTYKLPRSGDHEVRVGEPYERAHAEAVVSAAIVDYEARFGSGSTP